MTPPSNFSFTIILSASHHVSLSEGEENGASYTQRAHGELNESIRDDASRCKSCPIGCRSLRDT
jgi:hypothetical protein